MGGLLNDKDRYTLFIELLLEWISKLATGKKNFDDEVS